MTTKLSPEAHRRTINWLKKEQSQGAFYGQPEQLMNTLRRQESSLLLSCGAIALLLAIVFNFS